MLIEYTWRVPEVDEVLIFVGSIIGSLSFLGIAALVSWGHPMLCFDYGCGTTLEYTGGVFFFLATICFSVSLIILPLIFDTQLAALFVWGLALYLFLLSFQSFSSISGKNPEEFVDLAFKAVINNDITEITGLLKKHPKLIQERGHNENTLLHQSVVREMYRLIPILLDSGASIDDENIHGKTALDIAKINKDSHAIKLLTRKDE